MAKVEIRPTTRADVEAFMPGRLTWRIRGLTGLIDGEIIGIGGLAFLPDGTVGVFSEMTDRARQVPVALHKAGLATIAEIERLGLRNVVALADASQPAAERWLIRLGFEPREVDGEKVFIYGRTSTDSRRRRYSGQGRWNAC